MGHEGGFSASFSVTAFPTHKANHSDCTLLGYFVSLYVEMGSGRSHSEHPQSSGVLEFGGFVQPIVVIGEKDKVCVQIRASPKFAAVWTGAGEGS